MASDQSILTWPTTTADLPAYADEETHRLIIRCLAGDETGYVALYHAYSGMIYRLAYSMLQHKEDAEEVLQDSFEYAFRKLGQYDAHKASFKTWLYRIAISRCRNKRRRKWLPTFSLSQLMGTEATDKETPAPAETVMLTEKQRQVWSALQELSPKLRETAVLRYYENLTYVEIGDILDIPAKTVESRMRLAHKALREILSNYVIT
ncbi:MAG: RNA polymerase sigma factor [Ardenticatenaceae bacterium]|nr:RNA polymerase sigma factor [Ardenticatenaceae bacterium]